MKIYTILQEKIQHRLFILKIKCRIGYENWKVRRAFEKRPGSGLRPIRILSGFTLLVLFFGLFFLSSQIGRSIYAKIPDRAPSLFAGAYKIQPVQPVKFNSEEDGRAIIPAEEISSLFLNPRRSGSEVMGGPVSSLDTETQAISLVVLKSQSEVLVVEKGNGKSRIVERFKASMGEMFGDKLSAGDKRTPEGVYKITAIEEGGHLPKYYGPLAFVLDYPNDLDRKLGKTGSGIWIHGSGLGARTPNTRGCVELDDWNILKLSQLVKIDTPVLVFPAHKTLPIQNGLISNSDLDPERLKKEKEQLVARLLEKSNS